MSAVEQVAADEGPARFKERQSIIAFIDKRAASVETFIKRGRLTAEEGSRLAHWLRALSHDIGAQLHDDEPED